MKKSLKRKYSNLDNNIIYEENEDDKVIEYEHIIKFNNLKKRKLDNDIEYLADIFDNFTCDESLKKKKYIQDDNKNMEFNMDININIDIEMEKDNITNNNLLNFKKLVDKINYIDEIKNIMLFDKYFNYDSLILLVNYLVKKYGENNIINEKITNKDFQKNIYEHICLVLYPSFLFDPYIFDSNYSENYFDVRIKSLEQICHESKCFFPTWKKIYNLDMDYNFNDMYLHQKNICIKFTKKIFEFYERIYKIYFNVIIGEIFAFMMKEYQIILNPFDDKFSIGNFNKWVTCFNVIIDDAKLFIENVAKSIQLDKIDELNQHDLTNLLNKLKKDFIDDFESITKNNICAIFKPMQNLELNVITSKFTIEKSDQKWSSFNSNCLKNINMEIIQIFKYKQYLNIMMKNKWITKFVY